jgi:hypothetical protein
MSIRDYVTLIEAEQAGPTLPKIVIKPITKDMRFIYIDGEKAGVLHLGSESEFRGFNTWGKVRVWTGEFIFGGKTIHIGSTLKISEMLAKVTRLVRSAMIRQSI